MPTIKLAVGKSIYEIDCPSGQEEKMQKLSAKINQKVNGIYFDVRGIDERTALVLCSMMLEEENEKLRSNKQVPENNTDTKSGPSEDDLYDAVSENMDNIAEYLEKLAKKIKNG